MVSLDNSTSLSRGSGFFMEDPLQNQDEEILIHPGALNSDEEPSFRPVRTIWVAAVLILLLVAVQALVFLLPFYCRNGRCQIEGISTLFYLQTSFWCLLILIDQFVRFEHRKGRKAGYLHFCRKTHLLRRVTLYVYSVGNALLLTLQVIFQDFSCEKHACQFLKPVNYVQLVISGENLIAFPFVIVYIVHTLRFNSERPPPDVIHDDLLWSFSQIRVPTSEVGYRDEEAVDEVIEKQADVIRYLKQHNTKLGKKLVEIMAELQSIKPAL